MGNVVDGDNDSKLQYFYKYSFFFFRTCQMSKTPTVFNYLSMKLKQFNAAVVFLS